VDAQLEREGMSEEERERAEADKKDLSKFHPDEQALYQLDA